jgi:hypothetical protein
VRSDQLHDRKEHTVFNNVLLGLALVAPADTPIEPITEAEVQTAIDSQWGTDICTNSASLGRSLADLVDNDEETLKMLRVAIVSWITDQFEEEWDGPDVGAAALSPEAEKRMKVFLAACMMWIDGR